jgi:hypothetical protein
MVLEVDANSVWLSQSRSEVEVVFPPGTVACIRKDYCAALDKCRIR